MPVQQRPIHRPGSPESAFDESQYAAFAAAQFRILKEYMQLARLNTFSRVVTLANGVVITCQKCFNREDIFIHVPTVSPVHTEEIVSILHFLFNPREPSQSGYLVDAGTCNLCPVSELPPEARYPGAWDGLGAWAAIKEHASFGNINWKSSPVDGVANSETILSWFGPPSRYFPIDQLTFINDLTWYDEEITIDGLLVPIVTCFRPWVFCMGSRLHEAKNGGCKIYGNAALTLPQATSPKVLGAALIGGALVTIVGTNYRGMENPDTQRDLLGNLIGELKTGGFYYELYVDGVRYGFKNWSRQKVPFFFRNDGLEAKCIQENYEITCSVSVSTVDGHLVYTPSWTTEYIPMATKTTTYLPTSDNLNTMPGDAPAPPVWTDDGRWAGAIFRTSTTLDIEIKRNNVYKVAVDYKDDGSVVYANLTMDMTKTQHSNNYSQEEFDLIEFWLQGERPVLTGSIQSTNTPHAGCFTFTETTADQCPIESAVWSWSYGTMDGSCYGTSPAATCGSVDVWTPTTVSVTFNFYDGRALTFSVPGVTAKSVDSSMQGWQFVSSVQNNYTGCGGVWGQCIGVTTVAADGLTKWVEHILWLEDFSWALPCAGDIITPKSNACIGPAVNAYLYKEHQYGVTTYRWGCP